MKRQRPREIARPLVTAVGIAITVVLIVGGLAVVGAFVFVTIAMSNFGSNK